MLFTIIVLAVLIATALVIKNRKKITIENSCCDHHLTEEVTSPTHEIPDYVPTPRAVEEPLDTVAIEAVPTTPPSLPTMAAKKKKKPVAKKKPAKADA